MTTTHNIQTYPCTCPHLPQALRAACIRLLYSSDAELLNQLACQPAVLLATRKKKKETVKNTLPRNAAQLKIRYQTTTYEYSYELHSIPIARYRWRALAAQDTSPKPRLRAEVSRKSKNQKRLRSSLQCRLSIPSQALTPENKWREIGEVRQRKGESPMPSQPSLAPWCEADIRSRAQFTSRCLFWTTSQR